MEKIGFFKVLGMVGMLAEELSRAAVDEKITLAEAVAIVRKICEALGIDFEADGITL